MSHTDQACFGFLWERMEPPSAEPQPRAVVYVDELRDYPEEMVSAKAKSHGTRWCHLWADGPDHVDELHRIAKACGLKLAYFQNRPGFPHYDLVPSKRALAIAAGARAKCLREWLQERRPREAAALPPVAPQPVPQRFSLISNPSPVDLHSLTPPRHIRADRRTYHLQVQPAIYKPNPK